MKILLQLQIFMKTNQHFSSQKSAAADVDVPGVARVSPTNIGGQLFLGVVEIHLSLLQSLFKIRYYASTSIHQIKHPSLHFITKLELTEPKFQKVHQIFRASNVMKIMIGLSVHLREEAINSLVYEAEAWMRNPVYGCTGIISNLEAQLKQAEKDLNNAEKELAPYIGLKAMMPVSKSQPVMPQQQQLVNMPSVVNVKPQRHGGECSRMGLVIREQPSEHQHHQQQQQDQLLAAMKSVRDPMKAARDQLLVPSIQTTQQQQAAPPQAQQQKSGSCGKRKVGPSS
ncbi:hypothetical protein EZV62_014061 [Acer yangbiense]|uniref:LOB domain-containing protein n=1 Tax=Acer yangbiense TaxID=1000413 RepID=A0A5C7HRQ7_9ROSI|nr:hypothetical protein EZV62_014061 [Acer yangbiense]